MATTLRLHRDLDTAPGRGASDAADAQDLDELRALARRVTALPERPMRHEALKATLEAWGPEAAAGPLRTLYGELMAQPFFDLLREELALVLAPDAMPGVSYDFRAEMYVTLGAVADPPAAYVQRLLRARAPVREGPKGREPDDRTLQSIPLGRRRTLARRFDRELLAKLSRDPDPIVVQHLLQNPRLTGRDVVRMAAMRPVPPETLRAIAAHPRWTRHPDVRRTIARNPFAPPSLATSLLPSMTVTDLRALARDPTLHDDVRAQARTQLAALGAPLPELPSGALPPRMPTGEA